MTTASLCLSVHNYTIIQKIIGLETIANSESAQVICWKSQDSLQKPSCSQCSLSHIQRFFCPLYCRPLLSLHVHPSLGVGCLLHESGQVGVPLICLQPTQSSLPVHDCTPSSRSKKHTQLQSPTYIPAWDATKHFE